MVTNRCIAATPSRIAPYQGYPRRFSARGVRPQNGGLQNLLIAGLILILISGCAGVRLKDARKAFHRGDVDTAVQIVQKIESSGFSKLEYLMEKGAIYHHTGMFEESIKELRQAADLILEQDTISIGQQTGSLVINEWVTEYKGEYAERLWVHTYLMMDYLLLMKWEDALVEAKQAQKVLDEFPEALERAYFTRALIALCYEVLGEDNDAYIVYKKLSEIVPDTTVVRPHLIRLARQLGFQDELGPGGEIKQDQPADMEKPAELIVFVSTGKGPQKISGNILLPPGLRISFPRYREKSAGPEQPDVSGNGIRMVYEPIETDVLAVADDSLGERAKLVYAKEAARVAAKEAIVQSFQHNNRDSLAGLLIRMAFMAMEEADTRGWETLPGRFSMVRLQVLPGKHRIRIRLKGGGSGSAIQLPERDYRSGEKVFLTVQAGSGGRRYFWMRPQGALPHPGTGK